MQLRVLAAIIFMHVLSGQAAAMDVPSRDAMSARSVPAAPPIGFLRFCLEYPQECGESPARSKDAGAESSQQAYWLAAFGAQGASVFPGSIHAQQGRDRGEADLAPTDVAIEAAPSRLDPHERRAVIRINRRINGLIKAHTDVATYGLSDHWALPLSSGVGRGDCEDYVLEKRKAMAEYGFAPEAMSIAIVSAPGGLTHAVLLLNTDKGVLFMDNLTPGLQPLAGSSYRVLLRQTFGDPMAWVGVI